MQKRGDRIELVQFPTAEHRACDNATNRVHSRYGRERFKVVVPFYQDLATVFRSIFALEKRLNLVFANAGISETSTLYDDHSDFEGDTLPPEPDLTLIGPLTQVI